MPSRLKLFLIRLTIGFRLTVGAATLLLFACSSGQKRPELHLSKLESKKVALVSVEAEPSAKSIIEVALVNQLVKNGTFILISKQDVELAKNDPQQNPNDLEGLARSAGADFALVAKVEKFVAETREGYSKESVIDSQYAEEQGTDGKTERIFKVKSLEGIVQVNLKWFDLAKKETMNSVAEAHATVEENSKKAAIHLPPPLRFLEKLTNEAFKSFFEKYQ